LAALRQYQRAWNEKAKMFSDAPLHNWTSHGSDALRTFAAGYRDPKDKPISPPKVIPPRVHGRPNSGNGWLAR